MPEDIIPTLQSAIDFVVVHASADDLARLAAAIRRRHAALTATRTATLTTGVTVRLVAIRPEYLRGLTGRIVEIARERATVALDTDSTERLRDADQTRCRVPLDATGFEVPGVPLVCCQPIAEPRGDPDPAQPRAPARRPPATMRVTIAGIYSEYEVPFNDDRWNGWGIPGFTLDQVRQLAAESDVAAATSPPGETDTITISEDGVVSVHSGQYDETTIVPPSPDGLYFIGAADWAWEIVD